LREIKDVCQKGMPRANKSMKRKKKKREKKMGEKKREGIKIY